jgi:ABC-type Fe3+/spermidine/putrescine transport system ATPase subunit
MSEPVIHVEDLSIGWGDRVLMQHLTFDVPAGDIFAILGGSGSGKSTLLRNMIGLETPMAGKVHIQGVDESDDDDGPPAFGVLFQSGRALRLDDRRRERRAAAEAVDRSRRLQHRRDRPREARARGARRQRAGSFLRRSRAA